MARVTWPAADGATEYRFLLRDVTDDEIVVKAEGLTKPAYDLDDRQLAAPHSFQWRAQFRKRRGDWVDAGPYLRLERPSAQRGPALEWPDAGYDIYRVIVRDETIDAIV